MLIKCFKRRFRIVLLIVILTLVITTMVAYVLVLSRNPVIVKYRLQGSGASIRFVQISDTHFSVWDDYLERIAYTVIRSKPDVILVTGDTIGSRNGVEAFDKFLLILRKELPEVPIIAVLGNWELQIGVERQIAEIVRKYEGIYLVNNYTVVNIKDTEVVIAGLDDFLRGSPNLTLLEQLPMGEINVLLVHEPSLALKAVDEGFKGIIFAGHCHGSQVKIFGRPLYLPEGCPSNLYEGKHIIGDTVIIVSRGLGTSFIPLRIGVDPEVVVVEIGPSYSSG